MFNQQKPKKSEEIKRRRNLRGGKEKKKTKTKNLEKCRTKEMNTGEYYQGNTNVSSDRYFS